MSIKTLREFVDESRQDESPQLMRFPVKFAQIVGNIREPRRTQDNGKQKKPTSFVTTSGLQFVLDDRRD